MVQPEVFYPSPGGRFANREACGSRKIFNSTVPFYSIRQSRVTGPSETLKCHGGHGNFCKVTNPFGDHVPNIVNFRRLRRKTV
jgi:hypothetical protein